MKRSLQLLDCTLRDGGFVNDWAFGYGNIVSIFERLVSARLDIIEIGFLDERREFDQNRTIMPDSEAVQRIFGKLDKREAKVVGMIDYGTLAIDRLCPATDSIMDGIRVIFKKKDIAEALAYCKQVMEKGYLLFVQPVSITGYSDEEMLALLEKVNELKPYAISIVDTYGLLHKSNLLHYFHLMDAHLAPEIGIGYHSHNNFQLGYANAIELMDLPLSRTLTIDGSAFGMGKGAGNSPIELLAMYVNDNLGGRYDINQILEIIDQHIAPHFKGSLWGYSLQYFLAAYNDCHPSYVQHLTDKRTLSVQSINKILGTLAKEEKLSYRKAYIEEKYLAFQRNEINDAGARNGLLSRLQGHAILLLGPGKSIAEQRARVDAYITQHTPLLMSINFVPQGMTPDFVFVSNAKRYTHVGTAIRGLPDKVQIIATSNVTTSKQAFDYTVNYGSLMDEGGTFPDNSLIMLLKLLQSLGCSSIALAGFDGYGAKERRNYFETTMEYDFTEELATHVNQDVRNFLRAQAPFLHVEFITDSLYQ